MTTNGRAFKKPHTGSTVRLYFAEPTWQEKYREIGKLFGIVDSKIMDDYCLQIITAQPMVVEGYWVRDSAWPPELAQQSPKEATFVGAVNLAWYRKKLQHNGGKTIVIAKSQPTVWTPNEANKKDSKRKPNSVRSIRERKRAEKARRYLDRSPS